MAASANTIIKVNGLKKHYNRGTIKALDGVSVDIYKGDVMVVIGPSGSGKSTLLKLFMRFWQVQQGEVKISGKNVDAINTDNLRCVESFVTQDTHLFHDSIRNNLRLAKLDATADEIIAACKKASVHDFIMSLPKGYDTEVGELGDTLSGGERQRVSIARALAMKPDILCFDVPTSALDPDTERRLLERLAEAKGQRTVIFITHRPSVLEYCDRVLRV